VLDYYKIIQDVKSKVEALMNDNDFEPEVPLVSEELMEPLEWLLNFVSRMEIFKAAYGFVNKTDRGLIAERGRISCHVIIKGSRE
jgi:hypothetical protein